jgi:hypothetical protein
MVGSFSANKLFSRGVRCGYKDLYKLEEALRNNAPKLDGINQEEAAA